MGEYADFVESYGYDASDPDAMDNIMSSWANDERDHELQKKFQYELEKGKFAPSKPYHNSQIKTLGFNNFKPFAKEIQSFSKKPITLIYGPNSIGKSSFIHMSAYSRYMQKTKNLDLVNTDMFGDNINLGGFSKFIHKRDRNNTLTLEYEFEDCSEAIIDYLKLKQDISLDTIKALQLFNVEELETIINNSEKYILGVFTEANQVETCLYCQMENDCGSGINDNNSTFTKQQNEKLILRRKNNYLCNTIYPEEIHTSNNGNYRLNVIKNYIFSGYYEIETENDNSDDIKIVNINDIKSHKFLNEKGEFFNQDTTLFDYI